MNRPSHKPIGVSDLDVFTLAYIRCALWASTDNWGDPMDDNFGVDDLAPEALAQAAVDCRSFHAYCRSFRLSLAELDDEQAGHDFWLTRNGHGVGFWDRGLGKLGDDLSDAAKTFGSCDAYIGDDGKVYLT